MKIALKQRSSGLILGLILNVNKCIKIGQFERIDEFNRIKTTKIKVKFLKWSDKAVDW